MPSSTSGCRRLGQACLSAGFVLGLISAAAAQDGQPAPAAGRPAPGVEVEVANGLITLHADGAPLAEVLRAIGEAGGFRVVLRGDFASPVRESFADQPLEDAIRRLVEGHSVVMLHEGSGAAPGEAALAELRVIENPAQTAVVDATSADSGRDKGDVARDDGADEPPIDREAFRLAHLDAAPPTREEILLDLADPDQAARVAAVPKVGSLAPGAAIGILSGVFAEEGDPLVRSRAVAALARLEAPDARGLLRAQALGDDGPGLRMQALNALASSSGERAVNVLGQALRQDPEPEVRVTAVRALGRVGGDWARLALERATRDQDREISVAAEQALAAWRDSRN
jgi:HEAT repeats